MDSAVLFDRWTIVPQAALHVLVGDPERGFVGLDPRTPADESYFPSSSIPVVPFCFIDGDPRFLALYERKVLLCDPRVALDVEAIPVVAMTTADFFDLVLKHEGRPWFDDEGSRVMLYPHLVGYHDHLRRVLREPREGEPIPTDLSAREKERIVTEIYFGRQTSPATLHVWWEALRIATGTELTFEYVFRKESGRHPMHVLRDLGVG